MGIRFEVVRANGRSTCKLCKKKILEGDPQVMAFAYQSQGSVHLTCLVKASKTYQ